MTPRSPHRSGESTVMRMKFRPIHSLSTAALAAGLQLVAPGCDGGVGVDVEINVSTSPTSHTSPGPDSGCGDDLIDPGEQCDDGEANGPGPA